MFKKPLLIALILMVLVFFGYNYLYQDHRDIAKEEAEYVMSSHELAADFAENSVTRNEYLDKTIVIAGKISAVNNESITLNNKVFCQFDKQLTGLEPGSTIKIKGRCIGYDGLLEQVKLDQCSIIK